MNAPHDAPDARPRVESDAEFVEWMAQVQSGSVTIMWKEQADRLIALARSAATITDLTEKVERLEREVDRLSDQNSELRQVPWPEWAEKCLRIIRDCSGNTDEECDLPEELEELLSEWDKADAAIARADTAERALATAQERIAELEAAAKFVLNGVRVNNQTHFHFGPNGEHLDGVGDDTRLYAPAKHWRHLAAALLHPEPRHD